MITQSSMFLLKRMTAIGINSDDYVDVAVLPWAVPIYGNLEGQKDSLLLTDDEIRQNKYSKMALLK